MDRYNRYHSQKQCTQQQSLGLTELSEENDNIPDTDIVTAMKTHSTKNTNYNNSNNDNINTNNNKNNKTSSSVFGSHSKNWSNNLSKSFKKLAPSKLQKKYESTSDAGGESTHKNKTDNMSEYDNDTSELNRSPILQNLTLSDKKSEFTHMQRDNRNKTNDNFLLSNKISHHSIDDGSTNSNYFLNYDHHSNNNYMNNKPRRKNYSEQTCVFCLEPLKSTLNESLSPFQFPNSNNKSIDSFNNGERIIELVCSDQCHEHCLAVLMQLSNSGLPKDNKNFFPLCLKCKKTAIPSNSAVAEELITKLLISLNVNNNGSAPITMSSSKSSKKQGKQGYDSKDGSEHSDKTQNHSASLSPSPPPPLTLLPNFTTSLVSNSQLESMSLNKHNKNVKNLSKSLPLRLPNMTLKQLNDMNSFNFSNSSAIADSSYSPAVRSMSSSNISNNNNNNNSNNNDSNDSNNNLSQSLGNSTITSNTLSSQTTSLSSSHLTKPLYLVNRIPFILPPPPPAHNTYHKSSNSYGSHSSRSNNSSNESLGLFDSPPKLSNRSAIYNSPTRTGNTIKKRNSSSSINSIPGSHARHQVLPASSVSTPLTSSGPSTGSSASFAVSNGASNTLVPARRSHQHTLSLPLQYTSSRPCPPPPSSPPSFGSSSLLPPPVPGSFSHRRTVSSPRVITPTKVILRTPHQHKRKSVSISSLLGDASSDGQRTFTDEFVSDMNLEDKYATSNSTATKSDCQDTDLLHDSTTNAPQKKHFSTSAMGKKASRGSSISGTSSIISSVDKSPFNSPTSVNHSFEKSNQNVKNWLSDYPLQFIKVKLKDELRELMNIRDSDISSIDESLKTVDDIGGLRLIDKLFIGDGLIGDRDPLKVPMEKHFCYLFKNALVLIGCQSLTFRIIKVSKLNITSNLFLNIVSTTNSQFIVSTNNKQVLEKWGLALSNETVEFPKEMFTHTMEKDELRNFMTTKSKAFLSYNQSPAIPEVNENEYPDMHSDIKLHPGVDPRFHESTITSLWFQEKPSKLLFIVNLFAPSASSRVAIQNILKSFLLIKIDLVVIFASDEIISENSEIWGVKEISSKESIELQLEIVENFHEDLSKKMPKGADTKNKNNDSENSNFALLKTLKQYDESLSDGEDIGLVKVVVSSGSLEKLILLRNSERDIFIEINNSHVKSSRAVDDLITTVISWDDVMEVVCNVLGLEFDDSDFEDNDDDDDDDDEDDD
ncbi:hypothetical protein B5S33_g47 [[Candida] boidinii]|nr:hypothetical protein B5S33_g47 [[Candida] boidinii]